MTQRAFWMLSSAVMHYAWPTVASRGLIVRRHHSWIYWDTGAGLPPRIDHLTRFCLPSSLVPADDGVLPHDR
jgi:hypothetical protein